MLLLFSPWDLCTPHSSCSLNLMNSRVFPNIRGNRHILNDTKIFSSFKVYKQLPFHFNKDLPSHLSWRSITPLQIKIMCGKKSHLPDQESKLCNCFQDYRGNQITTTRTWICVWPRNAGVEDFCCYPLALPRNFFKHLGIQH